MTVLQKYPRKKCNAIKFATLELRKNAQRHLCTPGDHYVPASLQAGSVTAGATIG